VRGTGHEAPPGAPPLPAVRPEHPQFCPGLPQHPSEHVLRGQELRHAEAVGREEGSHFLLHLTLSQGKRGRTLSFVTHTRPLLCTLSLTDTNREIRDSHIKARHRLAWHEEFPLRVPRCTVEGVPGQDRTSTTPHPEAPAGPEVPAPFPFGCIEGIPGVFYTCWTQAPAGPEAVAPFPAATAGPAPTSPMKLLPLLARPQ